MNNVSIYGILKYLLRHTKMVLMITLFCIITSIGVAYLIMPPTALSDQTKPSTFQTELNAMYKEEVKQLDSVTDNFPQLQFKDLYRTYTKYFISLSDPLRADKVVNLYSGMKFETEQIREEYCKLTGIDFSETQFSKLLNTNLKANENIIEFSAYGPTPESSEYLAAEYTKVMLSRQKNVTIQHDLIFSMKETKKISKIPMINDAKTYYQESQKKKSSVPFSNEKDAPKAQISRKSHFAKYSLMGLVVGILLSLVTSIFGSSGNPNSKTLREIRSEGSPILGAYELDETGKPSLAQRIFARSLIKPREEIMMKSVFSLLPVLSATVSNKLTFFYDENISIEPWKQLFDDYQLEVEFVSISQSKEIFQALKTPTPVIAAIGYDQFDSFHSDIMPLLPSNSAISVVLK